MNKTLKNVVIGFAALTIFGAFGGCGEKTTNTTTNKPVAKSGYSWVAESTTNKFGDRFDTRTLNNGRTEITMVDKGSDGRMVFSQNGFIDCGNSTDAKIKIDDKPAKTVRLTMLSGGCKNAVTYNKALQNEILNAKNIVLELNPNGNYSGVTDSIEVAQ